MGRVLKLSPVLGVRVSRCVSPETFENIGANLCSVVHFGQARNFVSKSVGYQF